MKTRRPLLLDMTAITGDTRFERGAGMRSQRGFTLVEAVIAILITAIISASAALFIRLPVRGYIDSVARADVADTADTALRRISRDLRLALPNSVRVTTDGGGNAYIELLLTRTGGRYLSIDDNPTSGNILDFTGSNTAFDVVGPMPSGTQAIQSGDSVVVYNLGPGISPADAYATGAQSNRALISSISGNTITMASNPYSSQTVKMPSPYYRFQVISGPVTYRWDATALTLTRYWGYSIAATQPNSVSLLTTGAGAASALLANGVTACAFNYITTNSISSALVTLNITLQAPSIDNGSSGSIRLFQQVHVDNMP
jgi:MSHA biogenesis protein MshO